MQGLTAGCRASCVRRTARLIPHSSRRAARVTLRPRDHARAPRSDPEFQEALAAISFFKVPNPYIPLHARCGSHALRAAGRHLLPLLTPRSRQSGHHDHIADPAPRQAVPPVKRLADDAGRGACDTSRVYSVSRATWVRTRLPARGRRALASHYTRGRTEHCSLARLGLTNAAEEARGGAGRGPLQLPPPDVGPPRAPRNEHPLRRVAPAAPARRPQARRPLPSASLSPAAVPWRGLSPPAIREVRAG